MALLDRFTAIASASAAVRRGVAMVESGKEAEGFAVLARAADRGNAEAQYRVGRCYLEGKGVPPSRTDAALWLERAAEGGHVDAQQLLAAVLLHGMPVP